MDGFERRLRLCLQVNGEALRTVTPWLIVTLVAMVRGKGTHVNQRPESERQGELMSRKHPKGNRTYYVHAVVSG